MYPFPFCVLTGVERDEAAPASWADGNIVSGLGERRYVVTARC